MRETKKKVERMQPLLRIRKVQMDQEAAVLAGIRQTKLQALEELRIFQTKYIQGVEEVNRLRQEGDISQLTTLESSLDYVKSQWYQSLKKVKGIEEQERAQLENLLNAQRQLKSTEALNDRLALELIGLQKQAEQKELDEMSVQRFQRKPG